MSKWSRRPSGICTSTLKNRIRPFHNNNRPPTTNYRVPMQEFKVPELGENIEQGDVTRVLVKVGDTIAKDQSVVELETDKATIEVPSSVAGVVKEIKVKQGDKVKVGSVILTVDENGAGASKQEKPEAKAAPEQKPEPKAEQKSDQKIVSMPRRESPQPVAAQDQARAAAVAPTPPSPAPQASARQGPEERPASPKLTAEPRAEAGPAAPAS